MSDAATAAAAPDLGAVFDYEYPVDLTGDNAPAYVIALAGAGKRILEVGAGSGMVTRYLAKSNDVVAVEINPASAEKLKTFVEKVYVLDLNDPDWTHALAAEGKFDIVIAADVLEHVYDPWTALRRLRSLITPDGEIILSLPHVGHAALMGCLYGNNFDYRDWGLLDKTHIRFFGADNVEALHKEAELTIVEARIVVRRPEQTEFAEQWKILPRLTRASFLAAPCACVYQFVTRARMTSDGVSAINLRALASERSGSLPRSRFERAVALLAR